jgi:hypothetical protein
MSLYQLVNDSRGCVVDIEPSVFGRQLGMKDDLAKEITQLLLQSRMIFRLNSLDHLVRLFDKIGQKGLVSLGPIPGAALRGAKQRHQPAEPLERAQPGIFYLCFQI